MGTYRKVYVVLLALMNLFEDTVIKKLTGLGLN